jgi:3-isopropylmalate dehydrogenase
MPRPADEPQRTPEPGRLVRCLPEWRPGSGPGRKHLLGILPGEGVGPEVIAASLRILRAIESCTPERFVLRQGGAIGAEAERSSGTALTPEVSAFCEEIFAEAGAILCGPGGGRFVYDLRARLDLYCKFVPLIPLPALRGTGVLRPEAVRDVDILVVRENRGGIYQGDAGLEVREGIARASHTFHYDETQVVRILRVAVAAAAARRGRLCVVTKPSGVPSISTLWRTQAEQFTAGTGVELRLLEVDNAAYQLVADAHSFDVVLAPNMFGDVLADGASVLLGSRGMSYSANFTATGRGVYQTGHGAAHDLAGTDRANPLGQIQSLAMLLHESFGLGWLAAQVMEAVNDTLAAGWRTPDILATGSRPAGTCELAERIAGNLVARLESSQEEAWPASAGAGG